MKLIENGLFFEISQDVAKVITREASPEGIIAEVDIPNNFTDFSLANDRFLMLYRISDPGNFGNLLRTAKALDWNRVVLIEDCVDPFNPDTIRSSMGANFKTKFDFLKIEELAKFMQENFITLLIADMNGNVHDVFNEMVKKPVGLLLGSEANGFIGFPKNIYNSSPKIRVEISNSIESLNIAVCGGILMHNLR